LLSRRIKIANKGAVQTQRDYRARKSGTDIEIPDVEDPERKARCADCLMQFAKTYFKPVLYLEPQEMHIVLATDLQDRALHGGRKAMAAPRGSGKTTWVLIAILWAILYGHRRFLVYACENHSLADDRLAIIKSWLERGVMGDTTLHNDFPEVCAPIAALEGRPQRAASLQVDGIPCDLKWTSETIVLPTVAGSMCSAARIATTGLKGGVRGSVDAWGRPDYVAIDDPMGDEGAGSLTVIKKIIKVIKKGITQLVGQGKNIAIMMPCTIIERGDIGDQYTDRELNPVWNGVRYKYLSEMPDEIPVMWQKYIQLRKEKSDDDQYARAAHNFYLENREEMDVGHTCTLPTSYVGCHVLEDGEPSNILPDGSEIESSAIEHAYNIIADDGLDTFLSELQNEPIDEFEGIVKPLTIKGVREKQNGVERGIVPHGLNTVVAYFDCGTKTDIHFAVCAFGDGFTGAVIDWGKFRVDDNIPAGQAVMAGLEKGVPAVLGREYVSERGGASLNIQIALIDSGYETHTVYNFCNRNQHKLITFPTKGEGTDHFMVPKARRVSHGYGWWHGEAKDSNQFVYHVDANLWKSFVDARLRIGIGAGGCLSLNMHGKKGNLELIDSITSEAPYSAFKKRGGDEYQSWKLKINRRDNHLYDCVVGCHVAAARMGIGLDEKTVRVKTVRKHPTVKGQGIRRKY